MHCTCTCTCTTELVTSLCCAVARVACLDYNQYGELLQMEASPDGQQLALLIKTRKERFVWIVHFKLNRVITLRHESCDRFVVSADWSHVCTEGAFVCHDDECIDEVKLWRIDDGQPYAVTTFEHARQPVFSTSGRHVFFVEKSRCIEVFDLTHQRGVSSLPGGGGAIDLIQTVPKAPDTLLATEMPCDVVDSGKADASFVPSHKYQSLEEELRAKKADTKRTYATCSLWCISTCKIMAKIQFVAPGGIRDFSKDGGYCIDGYLQVFKVGTGHRVCDLNPKEDNTEYSLVRLTFDGQFAIWADQDQCCVRAVRVVDGRDVGFISTHEKPVSLELLDYGYVVVIGREDGNMLTVKLVAGSGFIKGGFQPPDVRQRAHALLGTQYSEGLLNKLEPPYGAAIAPTSDKHLPEIAKDIQLQLLNEAKVPHAVFKTKSHADLAEVANVANFRRCSSPIVGKTRSKESSPVHSATGSPQTLPRIRKPYKPGYDNNNTLRNGNMFTSALTWFGKKDKSSTASELLTTTKALQNVGSQMMALTDVSPQGGATAGGGKYRRSESRLSRDSSNPDFSDSSSANSSPCNTLPRRKHRRRSSEKRNSMTLSVDGGVAEYRKEVGNSLFFSAAAEEATAEETAEETEQLLKNMKL